MSKQKIEFEIDVSKVLGIVATLIAILGAIGVAYRWIDDAEETHEIVLAYPPPPLMEKQQTDTENAINKLTTIVDDLSQQQAFERKLWGDSYEKKISEILEKEDQMTNTPE